MWTGEQLEEREIPDVAHCKQTGHDARGLELSPGHHRTVLGQVGYLIMALPGAFMPQSSHLWRWTQSGFDTRMHS